MILDYNYQMGMMFFSLLVSLGFNHNFVITWHYNLVLSPQGLDHYIAIIILLLSLSINLLFVILRFVSHKHTCQGDSFEGSSYLVHLIYCNKWLPS
jgi:hypothetical protein